MWCVVICTYVCAVVVLFFCLCCHVDIAYVAMRSGLRCIADGGYYTMFMFGVLPYRATLCASLCLIFPCIVHNRVCFVYDTVFMLLFAYVARSRSLFVFHLRYNVYNVRVVLTSLFLLSCFFLFTLYCRMLVRCISVVCYVLTFTCFTLTCVVFYCAVFILLRWCFVLCYVVCLPFFRCAFIVCMLSRYVFSVVTLHAFFRCRFCCIAAFGYAAPLAVVTLPGCIFFFFFVMFYVCVFVFVTSSCIWYCVLIFLFAFTLYCALCIQCRVYILICYYYY